MTPGKNAMVALRDMSCQLNKIDYLDLIFEGWDTDDPNDYYHNHWLVFRNSPVKAWCSLDDTKRAIFERRLGL